MQEPRDVTTYAALGAATADQFGDEKETKKISPDGAFTFNSFYNQIRHYAVVIASLTEQEKFI